MVRLKVKIQITLDILGILWYIVFGMIIIPGWTGYWYSRWPVRMPEGNATAPIPSSSTNLILEQITNGRSDKWKRFCGMMSIRQVLEK